MKKGCFRVLKCGFLAFVLLVVVWCILNFAGAPGKGEAIIPISPETTIVDGPINADGDVDHVAYLNELHGKGVTPEENAAVAFLEIVGPAGIEESLRGEVFSRLGILQISEEGEYFREFHDKIYGQESSDIDEQRRKWLDFQDEFSGYPWKSEDAPDLSAWMDENKDNFDRIRSAAEKPRYFFPMVNKGGRSNLIAAILPLSQEARAFARSLYKSAMRNLGEGNVDASFADTMAMRKISRLIAQGPTLVDQLVAIAIDGVASSAETSAAQSGMASREQLEAYRDQLAKLEPLKNSRDCVDTAERMMYVNVLTFIAREGISSISDMTGFSQGSSAGSSVYDSVVRGSTDWGEAARVGNSRYDRLVDALSNEDYPAQMIAIGKLEEESKKEADSLGPMAYAGAFFGGRGAKGRLTGSIMSQLILPAISAVVNAETRGDAFNRMQQIVFSLEMYKLDHGKYPGSLDELSPDYLETVPFDPFSLKPFTYKQKDESYLLYTVGSNMIDDGGTGYGEGENYGQDGDDYRMDSDVKSWEEFKLEKWEQAKRSGDLEEFEALMKANGQTIPISESDESDAEEDAKETLEVKS